jgi:hypothetical protein
MQMPQPTAAHQKLKLLEGNWMGQEHISPSPFDPQGGPAVGRASNRLALDGFVIVQDYQQERGGKVSFRGHAVLSWDAAAQCYVMHWWDSMGMPPNIFRGQFQGDVLTLVCDDQHGRSRATFNFSQSGRYSYRHEVSPDGQQWFPFMEGEYERQDG